MGAKCEHIFAYKGRYGRTDPTPLPGTGSRGVDIYDVYFCTKCLHEEKRKVPGLRYQTYGSNPWKGEWL